MRFYVSYNKAGRASIDKLFSHKDLYVPIDEMVEDSGLFDNNDEITSILPASNNYITDNQDKSDSINKSINVSTH